MSLVQEDSVTDEASRPALRLRRAHQVAIRRALYEILLVTVLFMAYKIGRVAAAGHVGAALDNAAQVWHLERLLGLPSERWLQHQVIGHEWLIWLANRYYAYVHFPATAACLVWLYIWRRPQYLYVRRLLAWLTAAALAVHLLMPLAPPRMLGAVGMIDTGKVFGPAVYGPPDADSLTNQFAAMPSLHFGWALAVAIALIGAFPGQWRWLWLAHPAITLLVIVVTGNHYWLDAMVAGGLLGMVSWVLRAGAPSTPAVIPRQRVGAA
jgi:hypothetical protein